MEYCRLIPTYSDRQIMCHLFLGLGIPQELTDNPVYRAKHLYDKLLKSSFKKRIKDREDMDSIIDLAKRWLKRLLTQITILHFETQNARSGMELFQWLQEKSMLGSMLLFVEFPGEDPDDVDLIRNHLHSYFLGDELRQQQVYENYWLPLESSCDQYQLETIFETIIDEWRTSKGLKKFVPSKKPKSIAELQNYKTYFHAYLQMTKDIFSSPSNLQDVVEQWMQHTLDPTKIVKLE
eukprot:TRINITY_DN2352_c0_g1_i2.p1 TRINITY_DN2352_c0_g1~~TRINITY_DN2352_c0_g1_i2.p1  ORF type:complete len:236 (+),score=35.42 TRINITY_DN2352_c0_g1_i2:709-1416(+)